MSALDVSTQSQVINLLEDLKERLGVSYLFISHDLAVVRHISDRIGVMYRGRIVEEAPAEQLYAAPRHPYTRLLLESIPTPDPQAQADKRRRRRAAAMAASAEVPGAAQAPSGCAFAGRCPLAMAQCRSVAPQTVRLEDGSTVECHLYPAAGTPAATATA